MKKTLTFVLAIVLILPAFSQSQYEVLTDAEDNGAKIFKGIITPQLIQNEASYKWYAENLKNYTPNASAVKALKSSNADSVQLIVFMGTWCHDSQYIIPKLFTLLDATSFSKERVTLIAVDKSKKTISHLAEALDLKSVPTIIAMKNGKELGRVVEYGKTGLFDKELGEIIAPSK